MAAVFNGLEDAILLCDEGLVVLATNRVASELLRTAPRDLVGKHVCDILPGYRLPARDSGTSAPSHVQWRCQTHPAAGSRALEIVAVPLSDQQTGAEGWTLTLKCAGQAMVAPEFVGRSSIALELLEFTSRIAASRARSILLVGESGTGKDLIAQRLHALSSRARAPFVAINCAALPEPLLESELFGHEKGAFTGADSAKEGLLETAHGGTVFLDEVSELSVPLQAKLLRVLEDHTFRRVGGSQDRQVDLRVIGATNRDLERALAEFRFRSDLYYRLNVVQIRVPALREHPEDIPLLAAHFLQHFGRVHHKCIESIHPGAQQLLELYSWPGNVRELRNVIERAVLVETSPMLTTESLAILNLACGSGVTPAAGGPKSPHERFSLRRSEQDLITAALAQADGNQTRAAGLLGIGRFSLRYKMKKLGMLDRDCRRQASNA